VPTPIKNKKAVFFVGMMPQLKALIRVAVTKKKPLTTKLL